MPWVRGFDDLIKLTPVFSDRVPFDGRPAGMTVDIYCDGWLEQSGVPLSECFPDDPEGYAEAHRDLLVSDKHRCGGGAQPTFDLRRCGR